VRAERLRGRAQATKNLVFLAPHLYEADLRAGRVPAAPAPAAAAADAPGGAPAPERPGERDASDGGRAGEDAGGGSEREDGPSEDRGEGQGNGLADDQEDGSEDGRAGDGGGPPPAGALTLHGLVRRMARQAEERAWPARRARLAALRFAAALASRLGGARLAPYLPALLRPLLRLTEGAPPPPPAAGAPEAPDAEARALAAEVLAHLRGVAGPDALLAAYNAARAGVAEARGARRRARALQALADPEAAAAGRLRKQARRAAGRKRTREVLARQRAAGLVVKNKRLRARGGE
jgi:U3 small nucleolar RNA-associated protein 20